MAMTTMKGKGETERYKVIEKQRGEMNGNGNGEYEWQRQYGEKG